MKKLFITTIVLMQFLTVSLYAQKRTPILPEVHFSDLSDFVSDYDKRRTGQRIIVGAVPMPNKLNYERENKMYYFSPDEDGNVGNTFYMSAKLAKSLRSHLKSNTKYMWITCTLIEFVGNFDVFRSPFATKIVGSDEDGEIIWTISGTAPEKLKFRQ